MRQVLHEKHTSSPKPTHQLFVELENFSFHIIFHTFFQREEIWYSAVRSARVHEQIVFVCSRLCSRSDREVHHV